MVVGEVDSMMQSLRQLRGRRSEVTVAGDYPDAAVLVALLVERDELSVLLTQRASHLSIHPGESAFPGGKRDAEDPDLLATALREAQEEVALPPESFEYLFTLDQSLTRTDIKMTPFVGLIPPDVPLRPNPHEIAQIFTVPLLYFCDPANLAFKELDYGGSRLSSPSFQYGSYEIWGATARTMIDLVNIAFGAGLALE